MGMNHPQDDNADYLVDSLCAFYPSFVNHFNKLSKEQKSRLREDFIKANNYDENLIATAFHNVRRAHQGNGWPALKEILDETNKILYKHTVRPVVRANAYDEIDDEIYVTAKGLTKSLKTKMDELFEQIKGKYQINGHQLCRLAYAKKLKDELMAEYKSIQKELIEEVFPILSHFEKRPLSTVIRSYA